MNNNNKNNSFVARPSLVLVKRGASQAVRSILSSKPKGWRDLYCELYDDYLECRKNKRSHNNPLAFEMKQEAGLRRLSDMLYNREYTPKKGVSFIITYPQPREIVAADMADRIVQYHLIRPLKPYLALEYSPDTFSCRVGMGGLKAAEKVCKDIRETYRKYGSCVVAKFDIKGFFMHLPKQGCAEQMDALVCKYITDEPKRDLLRYLVQRIYLANPVGNAARRSPLWMWGLIPKDKSLYTLPIELGHPIGNWSTQTAALLYTSDYLRYVADDLGLRVTNYTDDAVAVAPSAEDITRAVPWMRRFLAAKGLELHPRKFWMQPSRHGLRFIGYYIQRGLLFGAGRICHRFCEKMRLWTAWAAEHGRRWCRRVAPTLQSTINSYLGWLGHCHTQHFREAVLAGVAAGPWGASFYFPKGAGRVVLLTRCAPNKITYRKNYKSLKFKALCLRKLRTALS